MIMQQEWSKKGLEKGWKEILHSSLCCFQLQWLFLICSTMQTNAEKATLLKTQMCGRDLIPPKYVSVVSTMPSFSQLSRRLAAQHPSSNGFCSTHGEET